MNKRERQFGATFLLVCWQKCFISAMLTALFVLFSNFSLANETCIYSDFAESIVGPQARVRHLRFRLTDPQYANYNSVKQHFIFSTIWGWVLGPTLRVESRGVCDAVITAGMFPDILIYLIESNGQEKESNGDLCRRVLRDIVSLRQPSPSSIHKSAAELNAIYRQTYDNPSGLVSQVSNVMRLALTHIYANDSIMQILLSIDPDDYRRIDDSAFFHWLASQQSGPPEIAQVPICPPTARRGTSDEKGKVRRFPNSSVMPPARLELSTPLGRTAVAALRHIVIVGATDPPHSLFVANKYCNSTHHFRSDMLSDIDINARVLCVRENQYSHFWLALYCDPKDCVTEEVAGTVAKTLAADPDVIVLGKESGAGGISRGPYLIELESGSQR